eukprot:616845-Hanusia_phi.AAC.1
MAGRPGAGTGDGEDGGRVGAGHGDSGTHRGRRRRARSSSPRQGFSSSPLRSDSTSSASMFATFAMFACLDAMLDECHGEKSGMQTFTEEWESEYNHQLLMSSVECVACHALQVRVEWPRGRGHIRSRCHASAMGMKAGRTPACRTVSFLSLQKQTTNIAKSSAGS